jgi:hypothetical protein
MFSGSLFSAGNLDYSNAGIMLRLVMDFTEF